MLPAMVLVFCGRGSAVRRAVNYWGLAITKWCEEERAASHVERQGFAYWLPRMIQLTARGLERRTLMFPGYIFFMVQQGWQALSSTRGIASVVVCDDRPARVDPRQFEYLRKLENARGLVVLPSKFSRGDAVQVVDGAYVGVRGIVQSMPAAGRCRVLWSMLGKDVKMDFAESSLASA